MKYFGNLVTKNNQKPSQENGMKSSLIAKTLKQIAVCKYLDKKKAINLPLCSTGHVTTDNMLKDLDVALRASRNYIESAHDEKMRAKTSDGFNLERQVC